MRPGILTLTTDFGGDGPYVAAMKGVVLGLAPGTTLVDVTHSISPQNILEGAFVLRGIVDAFPEGTVHLAVVDPGVGTDRRLVAARIAGQWFVGPDNGLLGGVALGHAVEMVRELANPAIRRREVSSTFHGRDVMAPAAAHLLNGGDPDELGPARADVARLANFEAVEVDDGLVGEVIYRDTFGNLITNVPASRVACCPGRWRVEVAGEVVSGLARTYADEPPGTLLALAGSAGWVEVAVVNGDAARTLVAGPGTTVRFRRG